MLSIKQTIMNRDGMSEEEADELIAEARQDLHERLANDKDAYDICEEWFGLEPDYIIELID